MKPKSVCDTEKHGLGRSRLSRAIELYSPERTLKSVYFTIAEETGASYFAVEKSVALAVGQIDDVTPKAYIAREKERLTFSYRE